MLSSILQMAVIYCEANDMNTSDQPAPLSEQLPPSNVSPNPGIPGEEWNLTPLEDFRANYFSTLMKITDYRLNYCEGVRESGLLVQEIEPVAEQEFNRIFNLPASPLLTEKDVRQRMCACQSLIVIRALLKKVEKVQIDPDQWKKFSISVIVLSQMQTTVLSTVKDDRAGMKMLYCPEPFNEADETECSLGDLTIRLSKIVNEFRSLHNQAIENFVTIWLDGNDKVDRSRQQEITAEIKAFFIPERETDLSICKSVDINLHHLVALLREAFDPNTPEFLVPNFKSK